jgi:hypothetical protein
MTAASYGISNTTIENYTGVAYTDLMDNGAQMTAIQWAAFCTAYVEIIAQIVHRYCNVPTFDPTQPEALIVELRSGRGATDDSVYPSTYTQNDQEFYLREIYFTGTIGAVTYAPLVVEVDTAGKTAIPAWTTRTVRSAAAGGDYEVITKRELTMVSFHNNVPGQGQNNVRFTYYTGYAPTSKPYGDIRFQVLRVFKNLILAKKGIQSVLTIFAQGTRDYSQLPNQYSEAQILSHMEESTLKRYKRCPIVGGPFTD